MTRFVAATCALLLLAGACGAGGLEDGIYAWHDGAGPRAKRNDGAEVVLGKRLGKNFGQASLQSVKNDNSQYRLDLKNAGPIDADAGYLAVIVDGVIAGVWSQSDRRPDGSMDLACTIHGETAARKVAERLKAGLVSRTHPGHRLDVRWSPEKDAYEIGEKVTLKLQITNAGNVPVTFRVGGQQRGPRDNQYRFLAYRGAGSDKAVPDTGDPVNFGGIASNRTLQPKESFTASVALDKWFVFAEPDTYRITGMYETGNACQGFRTDDLGRAGRGRLPGARACEEAVNHGSGTSFSVNGTRKVTRRWLDTINCAGLASLACGRK